MIEVEEDLNIKLTTNTIKVENTVAAIKSEEDPR